MKVKNWKLKIFLTILSGGVFIFFFISPALASENQIWPITVSATIGEPKLTIFGYTSPQAFVELKGYRVSDSVIANKSGYFYFDRVFLPQPNPNYPEVCLTVIDRQSRISSFPTCLPPLPSILGEIKVGPVLLPPTLTLEKGEFLPGEQVKAQGATFPNSQVTIYLANEKPKDFLPSQILNFFISPTWAFFLPKYETKSDNNGNFEFNLPAQSPQNWRIYAAAKYLDSPSPKSANLAFRILGWWDWFWLIIKKILAIFWGFLKSNWWWLVIGGEIFLIFVLLKKRKKKTKALILPPPHEIIEKLP